MADISWHAYIQMCITGICTCMHACLKINEHALISRNDLGLTFFMLVKHSFFIMEKRKKNTIVYNATYLNVNYI